MTDYDVVIIGGGVAGSAATIELRLAGWRVGLFHKSDNLTRVESLSPAAVQSLTKLSIDVGQGISEVVAWWGSEHEKRTPYPHARVVERRVLADTLRTRAVQQGATEQEIRGCLSIERQSGQWRLACETPESAKLRVTAAYLVDATGLTAVVARRLGATRSTVDQLFSLAVEVVEPMVVGTWTESTPEGWWNLSSLGEKGTLSFYSSAPGVREAKAKLIPRFEETEHLRKVISTRQFLNPTVTPCGSSIVGPCAGSGWFAVGDSAWTAQPLASAGVAKALRDGRIVRQLLEGEPSRYDRFQRIEFNAYLRQIKRHYSLETRWPDREFWRIPTGSPGNEECAEPSLTMM
jgi:flavin-dependent dehydrogenase